MNRKRGARIYEFFTPNHESYLPRTRHHKIQILNFNKNQDNEVETLLLTDSEGITVLFPYSLVKANDLNIVDNNLMISDSMYKVWFDEKHDIEYKEKSKILYDHFDQIIENTDLIISDEQYFNIKLEWLQSCMLYYGGIHYRLGALLKSWIESDDLRIPNTDIYVFKINGSVLSGFNIYHGWSLGQKCIVTGSIEKGERSWKHYFSHLADLNKVYKRGIHKNLLALESLIYKLNIN